MFIMNIIILIVVVLQTITIFNYVEGSLSNVTIDERYECKCGAENKKSGIKKMTRLYTFEMDVQCDEKTCGRQDVAYNITLKNNTIILKTFKSLDTFRNRVNGNELTAHHGFIGDGFCVGGYVYIQHANTIPEGQSCSSGSGMSRYEVIDPFVIIVGGDCDARCKGTSDVNFNPPVLNP